MDIIEDIVTLEARGAASPAFSVMARPCDRTLIKRAMTALGVADDSRVVKGSAPRHPWIHVVDDKIHMIAVLPTQTDEALIVRLLATPAGVLIIADDVTLNTIRMDIESVEGDGRKGLAAALVGLGRGTLDGLDSLADAAGDVAARAMGYTSAPERSEITRMRARLFAGQQLCSAHHRLLASEGDLAQALPEAAGRSLRQARAAFAEAEVAAARLYAVAGDVLAEQSAVVMERLTLVATIFLPLTVSTAFFGMNFGWMTDRLGSASAFLVLGVVVPALLTFGTLTVIRRVTGPGWRERHGDSAR